ncbi:MAG: Gfo/Idh/MocA family protein [Phycisphaeraceae bacterium]
MSEPVGLGLVGCGRAVEKLYVPALRAVSDARVVGVTDVNVERRALIAEQLPEARAHESLEQMLEDSAIEAVVIATPPGTHADVARQALRAERWALIEKPLAETLEQGLSLGELGEEATRRIMLGYNRRFWTPMRRLRETIAASNGAPPAQASIVFSINAEDWGAVAGRVDPLDDLASHYLDLLRFVFDAELAAVAAQRPHARAVRLKVRLSNGVEAEMHHEHGEWTQEHFRVQWDGRAFEARMGSSRIQPAAGPVRTLLDRMDQVARKLRGRGWTLGRSYVEQVETFARCVRRDESPVPGYTDGLAGLRGLDAARRSADTQGEEVSIDA